MFLLISPSLFSFPSDRRINRRLILPKGSPRLPHSPLKAPPQAGAASSRSSAVSGPRRGRPGHLLPQGWGQRAAAHGDSKNFCSRAACVQPVGWSPAFAVAVPPLAARLKRLQGASVECHGHQPLAHLLPAQRAVSVGPIAAGRPATERPQVASVACKGPRGPYSGVLAARLVPGFIYA